MVGLMLQLGAGDSEEAGARLVEAAGAADEACVRQLMSNSRPSWRLAEDALLAGVDAGSLGTVYEMTKRGVDSTMLRAYGWNTVHIAAANGVNMLSTLEQGGLRNAVNTATLNAAAMLPLHIAVVHGQSSMVQVMLGCSADIEAVDGRGYTPLMHAVEARPLSKTIIVQLLKGKAAVDTPGAAGPSPLALALRHEDDTLAAEILMEWKHQWSTTHFCDVDYDHKQGAEMCDHEMRSRN